MTTFSGELELAAPGVTAEPDDELERANMPPIVPRFRSLFGGLWTDLTSAHDLLRGKRKLGLVDEREEALLRSWIDQGYVVLEGAIPHALIDAVGEELEQTLSGELPRRKAEWWADGVKHVDVAGPEAMSMTAGKLLDLYVSSQKTREMMLYPSIVRFLSLVFERPPMAFQSLTMRVGTQQPVHADTTFVRVNSALEMVASWIALEDVQEGSGELEYYPGSHAIPELLFDGRLKWSPENATVVPNYSPKLHEHAREHGLELKRFRPKKGDVFFWAADLYHGGSAEIDEGKTRRSHVTHYCPVDRAPMYLTRRESPERRPGPNGGYWCAD